MRRHFKFAAVCLPLSACIGSVSHAAEPLSHAPGLWTYAGPQTVSPGQTISVTVEMTDTHGGSESGRTVQLAFQSDGLAKIMTGQVLNGLVSFDVPAETRSGLMRFVSHAGNTTSNIATVTVVASRPEGLQLTIGAARGQDAVSVTSEPITDAHGNVVTDQTLVTMNWIADDGIKASEHVQLSNGRLLSTLQCPNNFIPPLHIRAALQNIEVLSRDISALCVKDRVRS